MTVLDAVQRSVIDAFGPDHRAAERTAEAFGSYRQGAARMPEYAARFADVLAQARQPDSPFTPADTAALLKSAASAGLLLVGHPGGILGLTPEQLTATATAAGHLSETAARAVTRKKTGEISRQEYDLVTDPARELTRRVAVAVRSVTDRQPLVILLDTGEVIGNRAWGWLRLVMMQTGAQAIWVVGARFETEAEAGADSPVAQFVREIGDEHLVLMSPTRFDDATIRSYLVNRTACSYTDEQIDLIARFTRGLPLAVSLTATLLQQGQPVEEACREIDDGSPSIVISGLARRYLVHAEQQVYARDDPRAGDVSKILGLALAYGDLRTDPDLLAALWNVSDPLDTFQDLARRHDFVLPVSRRLHDDVRDTLRADLLDPYRRPRIREMNQRALDLLNARLAEMRDRWSTADNQLGHTGFTTAVLGKLWHTLWADNQAGLDLFTQILPVLAVADPATADAAAAIMDRFAGTLNPDQRGDLDLLTKIRPTYEWLPKELADPARRATFTMAGLNLQPSGVAMADPVIGDPADRQAAVMILQAQIHARDDSNEAAIGNLQKAATLTTSTRLRRAIGSQAEDIATQSTSGQISIPAASGLAVAKIAADLLPNSGRAWRAYATTLSNAGRLKAALAACDHALTLDPSSITAHLERGMTLYRLDRFQDALAAFDQALTLPGNDAAHLGRGLALQALRRPQDALAAYDQALTLKSRAATHIGRGSVLQDLGRFQDTLAAYDQALTLDPGSSGAYLGRGTALMYLGRFQDTLTACDLVLTLDPGSIAAHELKGIVLAQMGNLDDALAQLDTVDRLAPKKAGEDLTWAGAILWHRRDIAGARDRFTRVEGRVEGCTPFRTAEMEALALCGLGQADHAEQHLLDAVPMCAPTDRAEPRALYDLLSEPLLPGIDRLRKIIDSVI